VRQLHLQEDLSRDWEEVKAPGLLELLQRSRSRHAPSFSNDANQSLLLSALSGCYHTLYTRWQSHRNPVIGTSHGLLPCLQLPSGFSPRIRLNGNIGVALKLILPSSSTYLLCCSFRHMSQPRLALGLCASPRIPHRTTPIHTQPFMHCLYDTTH
jgi:hypothetical protein